MRNKLKTLKKEKGNTAITAMPAAAFITAATTIPTEILEPINLLKGVFIAVVAAIGIFIIIKNVTDMGIAIQQQDSHTLWTAVRGIAGGLMVAGIGALIAFLGF